MGWEPFDNKFKLTLGKMLDIIKNKNLRENHETKYHKTMKNTDLSSTKIQIDCCSEDIEEGKDMSFVVVVWFSSDCVNGI